ncbi:MAG: hypothetical protein B0D92_00265 [Spirochaeta sp. LUC14_002_19_P3]|nr:MAG: hypothetical protein B0D92_00265 [Spirochaeta sp. LUC14_002_19_P3]
MTDAAGGNRLNPALIESLHKALAAFSEDDGVRFILLRSNGAAFCLGMDLEAYTAGGTGEDFHRVVKAYSELLERIHGCSKTVVGLIEGPVKAGGVGVAAACDVVIASNGASFELSELYLGLIPANVMPYILAMRMPVKRAAYLVQSAACVDALTALHWGLVDEVHAPGDMEKALKKLGRRLMRISPMATARYKAFMEDLRASPVGGQQKDRAVKALIDIASGEDVKTAVKGFSDGETPLWFRNFRPEGRLSIVVQ